MKSARGSASARSWARKVALKRAGREFKGLSPFKMEKTPSFTVNDQKGFYHCFATGEHGDIFALRDEDRGPVVSRGRRAAGRRSRRADARSSARAMQRARTSASAALRASSSMSAAFFEAALMTGPGAEARRYLEKRGLTRETHRRFRLGYAPNEQVGAAHTPGARPDFKVEEMIASGMLIGGDDIPVAYDRFRHRVTFPIADLRGRVIAFGGRALDADAPAKYLNSPDTPLFHKGQRAVQRAPRARAGPRQEPHRRRRRLHGRHRADGGGLSARRSRRSARR